MPVRDGMNVLDGQWKTNASTLSNTHLRAWTHVCTDTHFLLQQHVLICDKSEAYSHCFSSHHLSWLELSRNLFQACHWCKYFPPTIWFGLHCSWKTFRTLLLEQRDLRAFFQNGIGLNLLHVSNLAALHWKWRALAFTLRLLLFLHLSWGGLVLCKFSFVWGEHLASTSSLVWINAWDGRFESMLPEMQMWGIECSAAVPHLVQNKANIIHVHPIRISLPAFAPFLDFYDVFSDP